MKKMQGIVAAAVLGCFALSAQAEGGAYVAADLGQMQFNSNVTGGATGNEAFPNPAAITVGAGFHFNDYLGVEVGYAIVADSKIETVIVGLGTATETVKTSATHVAAVVTLPVSDSFGLFGKLGMANSKLDYTLTSDFGLSATGGASGTKPMYAVGAQFNIGKKFGIRAQYADFGKFKNDACTGSGCEVGFKSISVGGVYNF